LKFEVQILGVGSATPVLERHPSAQVLSIDNESFLIDCGEGTQYRLLEQKIKHPRIRHVFISHLHGDHYLGLIGLISSLNLNQRSEELTVYGPKGLREILEIQFKYADTRIRFDLNFVEVDTTARNIILDHQFLTVETIPLAHRIPCCGFLFRTKPAPRKLLRELLPEEFPVTYMKMLKNGIDVHDELNQATYLAADFTLEAATERAYAYCSDTAYLERNVPQLANVNTMYHEATFTNELLSRAIETNHSTATQAAQIAQMANVGKLLIGHFSSRYKTLETFETEARAIFENTLLAEEGVIYEI
jgi:ribonuclease Z